MIEDQMGTDHPALLIQSCCVPFHSKMVEDLEAELIEQVESLSILPKRTYRSSKWKR